MFRRKKKPILESVAEQKLDAIIELVKDLSRADYNRLKDGMDLVYNGYQKVKNVKTIDERELEEIDDIERIVKEEA